MMERVDQVVEGYCRRVGAKLPQPEADGGFVLRFERGIEVRLNGSGRDNLLLRAALPPLKRDRGRRDALQRLMQANLLLTGRKHATLSFDNAAETPFLYDVVTVGPAEIESSHRSITAFVNEVAAFRKALEHSH
jgi:hypothetical protein